jgi:mercuric ion binding protein
MNMFVSQVPGKVIALVFLLLFMTLPGFAETGSKEYQVYVDGIACPFCVYGIEKQLAKLGGILEMNTDIAAGVIRLTVEQSVTLSEEEVRSAVEKAGFSLRGFTPGKSD